MALSVSTLEIFADRQPVEFGMTARLPLFEFLSFCRRFHKGYYTGLRFYKGDFKGL